MVMLALSATLLCFVCLSTTLLTFGQEEANPGAADAESQVHAVLKKQADRWNAGDIEGFMESYWQSPKLTFSSSGKVTRGWQATLDRYKQRYSTREKMGHLTFDNFEFTLLSDNVALVLGTWHLTRKDDAPEGNFSLVLRKLDGQWKIVHDHTSTLKSDE